MNRRTKERIDLRLVCRIGPEKVLSTVSETQSQVVGMTQNLSRCGLLMKWMDSVELPVIGSPLTVDIELPADASFGPRRMRCGTTVVRIIRSTAGEPTVGMKIRNIRFIVPPQKAHGRNSDDMAGQWSLESMPPASTRLN